MPTSRQLTSELFMQGLKDFLPLEEASFTTEAVLFKVGARFYTLECASTDSSNQITVSLVHTECGAELHSTLQFKSAADYLKWLQGFSRGAFEARLLLVAHTEQLLSVRLSTAPAQPAEDNALNRLPTNLYGNNQRILLVEDEENVRYILAAMLSNLNYAVTSCSDGLEALRELASSDYDLILVDAVIPRLAGSELIRRCREQSPGTRTVLMTAFRPESEASGETEEVLYKPFDMRCLAARLKREFPRQEETLQ